MKSLYKYFLIGTIISVSLTGCAKLVEEPVGVLSPSGFFKTPKDVQTAVFGGYGLLTSELLFGRQFYFMLMYRDDMVDIGDRGTVIDRIQVNDFNMDANNAMVRVSWATWYRVISAVNTAEAGAKQITAPENVINPLIAEARFLRAFAYYHLVQCFGDVPYIKEPISDPLNSNTITKTKAADIWAGIIEDLNYAKQWLPNQQPSSTRSRATKGAAAAFLASTYLTLGDYTKAYAEAKFVIDNRSLFGYRLEPDYQDLFRGELGGKLQEVIFDVDFLANLFVNSGANAGLNLNDDLLAPMMNPRNIGNLGGFAAAVPNQRVWDNWNPLDYRKKVSMADTVIVNGVRFGYGQFGDPKRPHAFKWGRFPATSNVQGRYSSHNYPMMRYAEVLLIAAEALAETTGVNAEAIDYVNQVRTRARNWPGNPTTFPQNVAAGISKSEFIDLLMEERKLEFCFEGKRWYDIKRRRLGDIVFKGANSWEPHANFDATRDYLFPLPQADINVNPNLLPNNPGY